MSKNKQLVITYGDKQYTLEFTKDTAVSYTHLDEIYFEYNPKTRTGRIVSGAPYTSYFEYGTGSVGQLNPHPDATGEWTYSTEGWWYTPDDGETFIWTYGQASKPFLWLTRMELQDRYGAQSRP